MDRVLRSHETPDENKKPAWINLRTVKGPGGMKTTAKSERRHKQTGRKATYAKTKRWIPMQGLVPLNTKKKRGVKEGIWRCGPGKERVPNLGNNWQPKKKVKRTPDPTEVAAIPSDRKKRLKFSEKK